MPPIHRVPAWVAAAGCLAVLTTPALAQGAASKEFESRFAAAWDLLPSNDNAATVNNLVITREQAQFELTSGQVMYLAPLDGSVVGHGHFTGAVTSGRHVLRVTAPGMHAYQSDVYVQQDENRTVAAPLDREGVATEPGGPSVTSRRSN
jgi:hypothetical protein